MFIKPESQKHLRHLLPHPLLMQLLHIYNARIEITTINILRFELELINQSIVTPGQEPAYRQAYLYLYDKLISVTFYFAVYEPHFLPSIHIRCWTLFIYTQIFAYMKNLEKNFAFQPILPTENNSLHHTFNLNPTVHFCTTVLSTTSSWL